MVKIKKDREERLFSAVFCPIAIVVIIAYSWTNNPYLFFIFAIPLGIQLIVLLWKLITDKIPMWIAGKILEKEYGELVKYRRARRKNMQDLEDKMPTGTN